MENVNKNKESFVSEDSIKQQLFRSTVKNEEADEGENEEVQAPDISKFNIVKEKSSQWIIINHFKLFYYTIFIL